MKFPMLLLSAVCGAVIAAGALYWCDQIAFAKLRAQASQLREQTALDAAERQRQLETMAAQIDALKQKLASADDQGHAVDAKQRELEAELARTRRALAATQHEYAATQAALVKAQAQLTAPKTPAAPGKIQIEPVNEVAARAQMARRYGALIQKLGLSDADADRFLGLMVSRRHAMDDVVAAAQAQTDGTTPSAADLTGMISSTRDGIESDLRALLGDAGYAQLQQYENASGITGTVARLQRNLAASAPLTDDQAQQLQQLLTDGGVGHVTPQVLATAQAQGFLNPQQLQALQALYAQQRAAQLQRRTGVPPISGPP